MADLTLRAQKGSPLTNDEVDANFVELENRINTASQVNPKLSAIASAVWAANQMLYMTGPDSVAMTPLTELGRQMLAGSTPTEIKTALNLQFVQNTMDSEKEVSGPQQAALDLKVDKESGKGLSSNDFTNAEKSKLAGLESSHYRGNFVTLAALQAAIPTGLPGDYADVDPGTGTDIVRYIWDNNDSKWVLQSGAVAPLTASQVKELYESNPDTNAFTDAEETKLAGVAAGATANATNAELRDRATHTGFQLAATISDFASAVASSILTGFTVGVDSAIAATDTVMQALGKIQAQLNAKLNLSGGNMTGPINFSPVVDVAGAATLNIDAAASQNINITGTGNTITALSTGLQNGTVRNLRFTGAGNVLNNSATLVTPGGQPMQLSANDVVTILKVATAQWVVMNYHRGDASLYDYALPITTSGSSLDLSTVTARSIVVSLASDITSITLPAYGSARRYRRIEIIVINTGNFKLSGWPAGTVFEAGVASPVRTGVNARTTFNLSKVDSLNWFMYQSTTGGGQIATRAPNTSRIFVPGALCVGVATNATHPINAVKMWPFSVTRPMTVAQLGIRVGTANAGTAYMAIYNNDGDLTGKTDMPGTKLVGTSFAQTPAGVCSGAAPVKLIPGVVYWIAYAPSIASAIYHYPLLQTDTSLGYTSGLTTACTYLGFTLSAGSDLPSTITQSDLVEAATLRPLLYIIEDIS